MSQRKVSDGKWLASKCNITAVIFSPFSLFLQYNKYSLLTNILWRTFLSRRSLVDLYPFWIYDTIMSSMNCHFCFPNHQRNKVTQCIFKNNIEFITTRTLLLLPLTAPSVAKIVSQACLSAASLVLVSIKAKVFLVFLFINQSITIYQLLPDNFWKRSSVNHQLLGRNQITYT